MKWLVLVLALPFLLLSGGLLLNRPPLLSPPGPLERLKTYLTTNIAETRPDHVFPELRTPLVPADPEQTGDAVLTAMHALGWKEIRAAEGTLSAVVVSPLFRFRDDVTVRLKTAAGGTLLQAHASSRVGKGDLGANGRHLRELFTEIERLVGDR
jgi:hypothetical protein